MRSDLMIFCEYNGCKRAYERPVTLICCGESLCEKHIDENLLSNKSTFRCPFCYDEFELPKKGFSINKKLEKILKMDLGQMHKEAKENHNNLKASVDFFNHLKRNQDYFLYEYFDNIKNQIDINREEWKLKIDNYHDELIKEISEYEKRCRSGKLNLKDMTHESMDQFSELNSEMSQFIVDENKWKEINMKVKNEIKNIEDRIENYRIDLLDGKLYELKRPTLQYSDESLFGKMVIHHKLTKKFDIISSSFDKTIRIWNIDDGKCYKQFQGHSNRVNDVKLFNDDTIISCSSDQTIKFWNIKSGQCFKTLYSNSQVSRMLKLDERQIITSHHNGDIKFWSVDSDTPVKTISAYTKEFWSLILNDDKTELITCSYDGILKRWNINTNECLQTIKSQNKSGIFEIKALKNQNEIIAGTAYGIILKYHLNRSICEEFIRAHNDNIFTIELLPNNKLATGSLDATIKIWDLDTRQCLTTLYGHSHYVYCLKFLPNNTLVSGSSDRSIKIWDLNDSKCVQTLSGSNGAVWTFEITKSFR